MPLPLATLPLNPAPDPLHATQNLPTLLLTHTPMHTHTRTRTHTHPEHKEGTHVRHGAKPAAAAQPAAQPAAQTAATAARAAEETSEQSRMQLINLRGSSDGESDSFGSFSSLVRSCQELSRVGVMRPQTTKGVWFCGVSKHTNMYKARSPR